MFESEKTSIFYTGLFIFGGSLFGLFSTLWVTFMVGYPHAWKYLTPLAFDAAVFLVISFYMMRIGVRKLISSPKGKDWVRIRAKSWQKIFCGVHGRSMSKHAK